MKSNSHELKINTKEETKRKDEKLRKELNSIPVEKMILNFIINEHPEFFDKIDNKFFFNNDINTVYRLYQECFKEDGIIPTPIIIKAKIAANEIDINNDLLSMMIIKNYKNLQVGDKDYIETEKVNKYFNAKYAIYINNIELLNLIDKSRNESIDEIIKTNEENGFLNPLDEEVKEIEPLTNKEILETRPLFKNELFELLTDYLKRFKNGYEGRDRDIQL